MKRRNLSLALFLALAAPAGAQTHAICDDIRARIADLPDTIGTGGNRQTRQYANALAEQNLELRKVRSDLRRYGCSKGSMVVIGGDNADYCAELEDSEARMMDNIRYLQDRRDEARGDTDSEYMRRQLLAALDDNNCDSQNFEEPPPTTYRSAPSIDDQASRPDTFIPPGGGQPDGSAYPRLPAESLSHVSTVCVRTCDGSFFPITSNATSFDFTRDAATCSKMCPGIQTELFYRDISSTDASTMISTATGTPYSAMTNAFAYRDRKPGEKATCTCNLAAYYEEMRRNQAISAPPEKGSITTIQTQPATGPAPAAKPAEQAQPQQAQSQQAQVPDRPYDPGESKVRQVGPQFLANDQGKIDLHNPAKTGPQPQQN